MRVIAIDEDWNIAGDERDNSPKMDANSTIACEKGRSREFHAEPRTAQGHAVPFGSLTVKVMPRSVETCLERQMLSLHRPRPGVGLVGLTMFYF
jgi:hypothetical protein